MAPQNASPTRIDWHLYDDDSGIIQPREWLVEYEPEGMHPVTLGDTFNDGRYRIEDKLGYGGYSTVWLARDIQEECVVLGAFVRRKYLVYADTAIGNGWLSKSKGLTPQLMTLTKILKSKP